MPNPFPGTGADGAIVFDGSSSVPHTTRSGSTYSLTGDINATSVTVNAGVTVQTCNYKIYCSGIVTIKGHVHNDGGSGTNGDVGSPTGGSGGSNTTNSSSGGTLLASAPGIAAGGGGGGTDTHFDGQDSAAGTGTSTTPGGNGGAGANICSGGVPTDSAGAGGSGAQGGGGGGGYSQRNLLDAGPKGGSGGGAGGYAGPVWISGTSIVITSTGSVTANGGNGGNGGNGQDSTGSKTPGAGGGGGGASGNGGTISFWYGSYTNNGTVTANAGTPGSGGLAGSAASACGADGTPGSAGTSGVAGTVPGAGLVTIGHAANCNAYDNGGFIFPAFPPGHGDLVDDLAPAWSWARANGIFVSMCLDSQRPAKDILDELATVCNSAFVYSGDTLKLIPYDEVSAAGYGAVYVAPTSAGPLLNLADEDFKIGKGGDSAKPPVSYQRKRRASCDNVVAIEHIGRNLDYAHNVTSVPDAMSVALYGPRKGGTLDGSELGMNVPSGAKALLSLHNEVAAQKIASILTKRSAAGVNVYSFQLGSQHIFLEAMDLVQIIDTRLGVNVAVRITSISEDAETGILSVDAEEYQYGLNHPDTRNVQAASGTLVNVNVDPGLVNPPLIFEPTSTMSGGVSQIWFNVSGADPNYGGCAGFVSVDGGSTYTFFGTISPATMGFLTADYPDSSSDPDTTDTLSVDLTESNGSMSTNSQAIADGFADPCYVGTNAVYGHPYETVCPTTANLTSANHYSLTTYIRRAVQGTAHMDHPNGSLFAVLDGNTFKTDIQSQWIGKTLHFKFAAFNKIGTQQNALSDCTDYTYTISGTTQPGDFYIN